MLLERNLVGLKPPLAKANEAAQSTQLSPAHESTTYTSHVHKCRLPPYQQHPSWHQPRCQVQSGAARMQHCQVRTSHRTHVNAFVALEVAASNPHP